MFNLFRNLISEKASVRLVVRGFFTPLTSLKLQAIVRSYDVLGWVQIVPQSHALIEIEGPKYKLEALILTLQRTSLSASTTVLEVTWLTYKNEYETFRACM
jgi:acylphosphatase